MLGKLIARLDLVNKIATHKLRAEFVSNVEIDQNGVDFLKTSKQIGFVGKKMLTATYISDQRDPTVHNPIKFDVGGFIISEYTVDADTKATIAPIKATELVKLEGIANQSLFEYNVRGPLGKTGVNRNFRFGFRIGSLYSQPPPLVPGFLNFSHPARLRGTGSDQIGLLPVRKKAANTSLQAIFRYLAVPPSFY